MCNTASIEDLPNEVLLYIFSFCGIDTLNSSSLVSKRWMALINDSEFLWKGLCTSLHECRRAVEKDRNLGKSWQETYKSNFEAHYVKKRWLKGEMSKPCCYKSLPPKPFCKLDEESWGEIFQMELDRC